MTRVRLLDTGVLGLITHPTASLINRGCNQWLQNQITKGNRVLIPGICDYELRRELIRIGSSVSIARLDNLKAATGFAEITTEVMDQAAVFWARARNTGKPTADKAALDGDMILSAHATVIARSGEGNSGDDKRKTSRLILRCSSME